MKRYMAVVMACIAIMAILAGCKSKKDQPITTEDTAHVDTVPTDSTDATDGTQETENSEDTGITQAPQQADPKGIVISTKYGNLYFQEQWEDFMFVEQAQSDTYVVIAFEADINGVRYPLFHLTIGESQGDPIGQITDAQGKKHDVFLYMEEVGGFSGLTEGEQNRLFAMQEEINYIIENLE